MGAGHIHTTRRAGQRRVAAVLVLTFVYMLAEVAGGFLTGSLALLADAGHMLSDVGALALTLFAIWVAQTPPSRSHTYGYYRAEILAALVNGAALIIVAVLVAIESYARLRAPVAITGPGMTAVAAGGLAVNLAGLIILHGSGSHSLNVRGAWLHVLSDALGSLGAIIAGLLVWTQGWYWADPVASALIAVLVLYASWALIKEAVAVLMEGAPAHIDVDQVRDAIRTVDSVRAVHDLHIWTITSGMVALSVHVVADAGPASQRVPRAIHATLHDRFGIEHTTVQVETEDCNEPCITSATDTGHTHTAAPPA